MRKWLILILVVLFLSGCSKSVLQPESGIDGENANTSEARDEIYLLEYIKQASQDLEKFDILDSTTLNLSAPGEYVTRAAFCELAVRLIRADMDIIDSAGYSDLPDDPDASGYMLTAVNLNLIEGFSDGTIRPDRTLTYEEALTMVLRALRYDNFVKDPENYISLAEDVGLMRNIICHFQNPITVSDSILMIRNALDIPKIINEIRDGEVFLVQSNQTLYDEYLTPDSNSEGGDV